MIIFKHQGVNRQQLWSVVIFSKYISNKRPPVIKFSYLSAIAANLNFEYLHKYIFRLDHQIRAIQTVISKNNKTVAKHPGYSKVSFCSLLGDKFKAEERVIEILLNSWSPGEFLDVTDKKWRSLLFSLKLLYAILNRLYCCVDG